MTKVENPADPGSHGPTLEADRIEQRRKRSWNKPSLFSFVLLSVIWRLVTKRRENAPFRQSVNVASVRCECCKCAV